MEILPRTIGTRPRLACEVRAEGVVAARAEDASAVLSAVSRVALADGVVVTHLRGVDADGAVVDAAATSGVSSGVGGSKAGRAIVVAAVRSALEAVVMKTREVTLVVPDAAVRVLLLDFDELPAKAAEALPVVRFRLKKLLPFDADDAAVSYQIVGTRKGIVQVIAVAMPREVLEDYENVVREAGFEPGAVIPSTLAALAGLNEGDLPMLVVNAGSDAVTTAIVKGEQLLLHRTVDLAANSRVAMPTEDPTESPVSERFEDSSIAAIAVGTIIEASREAPASEVAQAVSVAAAYFEDTLETAPEVVLSAGPMGAEALIGLLNHADVEIGMGPVEVQEMVSGEMLGAGAASAGQPGGVPLGWLAGVRGALAN